MQAEPLPDIRQALPWRSWHEGLQDAEEQGRPVLCLAEPCWTNSAQRLALVFKQDEALRTLIGASFVPILLDPLERPDLAARLRWASLVQTGMAGPPLLCLLTREGLPFLSYPNMWPEGRDDYPSLASLLRSVAERYPQEEGAFLEESHQLQALAEGAPHRTLQDYWQAVAGEFDPTHGGCRELPKHPQVPLLWLLLDASGEGDSAARAQLESTLTGMMRGGVFDQLGGSFHRCSRDARWVVPHFEKLAHQNAGLAAVYARAARVLGRPDFATLARSAASFVLSCLESEVQAIASDTPYYTWTSKEIQESMEPALLQAVGLHYKLTPDPSRVALHQAMTLKEMSAQSFEPTSVLQERLEQGKEVLRFMRLQRPAPEALRLDIPSWQAEGLRWLFEASRYDAVTADRLMASFKNLLERPFEPSRGYLRGASAWLEDQAAIGAACLAAYRTTGEGLEGARRVADVILEAYLHVETGALLDAPQSKSISQAVADDLTPSAVGTALGFLLELGELCGETRYSQAAETAARQHRPAAAELACRGTTFWRACLRG